MLLVFAEVRYLFLKSGELLLGLEIIIEAIVLNYEMGFPFGTARLLSVDQKNHILRLVMRPLILHVNFSLGIRS